MLYFDKHTGVPLKTELIDRIVDGFAVYDGSGHEGATFLLEQQNQFLFLLAYDEYHNPSNRIAGEVMPKIAKRQYELSNYFFSTTSPYKQIVPTEINQALQLWLTFGNPSKSDINSIFEKISPIGEGEARKVFDHYYVQGIFENNGRIPSDYNGGYHMFASLYAVAGEEDAIIKCFENLPESYFRSSLFNNYNNVMGYLYQYQHLSAIPKVSKWLVDHYPTDDPLTVYRNMVIRAGHIPGLFGINLIKNFARASNGYFHVNLGLAKRDLFFAIAEEYERLANEVTDPNERHYLLAMHYKRVAMLYSKYLYDRGMPIDQKQMDDWLDKAWYHYGQIGDAHLLEEVSVNYRILSDGSRTIQSPRKMVFLYPDYRDGYFAHKYNSDVFVQYLFRKDLLATYYDTPETIGLIHEWISSGHELMFYRDAFEATGYFQNDFVLSDDLLNDILAFADEAGASSGFDQNLPLMILANRSFEKGDTARGLDYFDRMNTDILISSGNKYEYVSQTYFINSVIDLATHLAVAGRISESMGIISLYEPYQKAFAYAAAAEGLYQSYQPESFVFLDSAFAMIERTDYNLLNGGIYDELDARRFMPYVLGKVGGEKLNTLARDYTKELIEFSKVYGTVGTILGTATDGNYYTALSAMPSTLTEDQELTCYYSILGQIVRSKQATKEWAGMDESLLWRFNYFLAPN